MIDYLCRDVLENIFRDNITYIFMSLSSVFRRLPF